VLFAVVEVGRPFGIAESAVVEDKLEVTSPKYSITILSSTA
jgi:hypothetical protein